MKFYVIYSLDVPRDTSVKEFQPPNLKLWDCTETDSEYDYGYLEGCWTKGKHRKYCALLTREEFDAFIQHVRLYPEDCETMGSLTGFGLLPAISFNDDCEDRAILNAYVTPVPQNAVTGEEMTGKDRKSVV